MIKAEDLKFYFTSPFIGVGTGNENIFIDHLIPALKLKRSAKELAAIALVIYNNDKVISKHRRPATFSAWYEIFCDCMGTTKKTYQPKDLLTVQDKITTGLPFLS